MFSLLKKFSHLPGIIQERVRFLWILNFLYQIGFIVSWVVISSLFIQEFGIQMLFWLFLAEGGLMILGSMVGRSLFLKYEDNKFLLGVLLITLGGVISAFLLREQTTLFFIIAIITKSLIYPQFRIGFLRKIESFFAPTNGRKAIPVIESAETIGTIFSALSIVVLLEVFSTEILFSLWAIPLLFLFGILFLEKSLLHKIKDFSGDYTLKSKKFPEIFTFERKKEFQNILVALIFFQSVAFSVVEFEFMKEVNTDFKKDQEIELSWDSLQANIFSDSVKNLKKTAHSAEVFLEEKIETFSSREVVHENIAHDLGVLSFFFGLLALVFKLGLTSKITKRFGIFRTMTGYFTLFFILVSSFIFGRGNWSLIRGYEHGFLSLFASSYHLSFYSTDTKNRELMRHFLEGIITPLGIIFSVGIIVLLQTYNIPLSYSVLFFLTGTIILSISLCKKYEMYTLQNFLSAQKIEEKIHLLEIIQTFKNKQKATQILSEYLKKNKTTHSILRTKIIETLSKLGDPRVIHDYLEILRSTDESEDIQIKVLESFLNLKTLKAYCEKKAFTSNELLKTWQMLFEKTSNMHMKKMLLMNIFEHISKERVVSIFKNVLHSKDEHLIAICLRSCMDMNDPEIKNDIEPLLKSKKPRVKSHAIMALWNMGNKKEFTQMLNELIQGKTNEECIAGIYAVGELQLKAFLPHIEKFLSTKDDEVRVHAIIALLKLKKTTYIQNLLALVTSPNHSLAHMAFHMRKRLDPKIREKVEIAVQKHISEKVDFVLKQEKVLKKSDFEKLTQEKKSLLHRLYLFVGRYENVYFLENTKTSPQ